MPGSRQAYVCDIIMHTYVYIYIYAHIYIYICMHVYILCVCVYLSLFTYRCMYISIKRRQVSVQIQILMHHKHETDMFSEGTSTPEFRAVNPKTMPWILQPGFPNEQFMDPNRIYGRFVDAPLSPPLVKLWGTKASPES